MYDIDTLLGIKKMIQKEIQVAKDNIIYSVDTVENLQYARGKLNALEALQQDIMNLQKNEE
jgi:hypothetical protein|tara:strand:- start:11 stop:193 length:183 start_codon:yes stop_codon:yes gene_type:complete